MHEMQIILRRVRFRVALRTGTHRTACQPDGGSVRAQHHEAPVLGEREEPFVHLLRHKQRSGHHLTLLGDRKGNSFTGANRQPMATVPGKLG